MGAKELKGKIVLDGWAGIVKYPVEIIGETPKRYRVRCKNTFSIGRIYHFSGDEFLVPKHAVEIDVQSEVKEK